MSATRTNGARARVQIATESNTGGLAEALLTFHERAPKLKRNAPGQIQNRTYTYTTLDNLLDEVEPLLVELGLLWTTKVTMQDGQPAALYEMKHVPSGESEEWTGPLPCVGPGPQNLGSAITYMRRYTEMAYLGLASEDDDGAAASQTDSKNDSNLNRSVNQAQPTAAAPKPNDSNLNRSVNQAQPTAAAPKPSERQITAGQREKLIKPRAEKAGLTDGEFANVMIVAAGDEPREWRSEEHATQTMTRLLDRLPMRLKDAVLEGIDAAAAAKS